MNYIYVFLQEIIDYGKYLQKGTLKLNKQVIIYNIYIKLMNDQQLTITIY